MSSIIDYSWDFSKEEFSFDLDFFNEKEQEDKLWQAKTGLNHDTLCGAIETLIFMSDRPINILKIKNQIDNDIPLRVIHEALSRLQSEYEQKHHGIRLQEVAEGYQFRTKATYSKVVQNMFNVQSLALSPTALEVLAILAYKQPLSKTAVESIRGVDSSHIIRGLMDKRLVKIVGRSDEVGRPSLYGTTNEFLEVFNLNNLEQLPTEIELEELAEANSVGKIEDIRSIVKTESKISFEFDEFEELDQLGESIKQIAADTMFTKSLKTEEKKRTNESGETKKSAFDILEEYLDRQQTIEQNKTAVESDVMMSFMNPRSVDIKIEDGLLNAPELDDEEVEFDDRELPEQELLADVDTELDQIDVDAKSVAEMAKELLEEAKEVLEEATPEEAPIIEAPSEEQALEAELDAAFENLFGDTLEDEKEETQEEVQEKIDDLELVTAQIAEKAKDLDLDLDFMKE
jgi:segregation and condensation protein B